LKLGVSSTDPLCLKIQINFSARFFENVRGGRNKTFLKIKKLDDFNLWTTTDRINSDVATGTAISIIVTLLLL
jgi:hypothetical protein